MRGEAARDRTKWLRYILAFLLSGGFLYLVLRSVDFRRLGEQLRSAEYAPLLMAICIAVINSFVRAIRWKVLLGANAAPRLRPFFSSMMIGYLANNIFPARLGEIIRIYVLNLKTGLSKSASAATVVLERIIDALILVAIVAVISFFLPVPVLIRRGCLFGSLVFLVLMFFLLLLDLKGRLIMGQILRLIAFASKSASGKAKGILERFREGLTVFHRGKQFLSVLSLTVLIWSLETISVILIMGALHMHLPWPAALLVVTVISLSFVIPAAPGAMGTYEFFTIIALSPFTKDKSLAFGLALVLHATMYLTSTATGLICLWSEGLSLRSLAAGTHSTRED